MKENNNPLVDKKVEDLLKPRYKVIADYPFCPFEVGEILYEHEGKFYVYTDSGRYPINPNAFPAIFKELMWWEERKESEMPGYLKWNGNIYKVARINQKQNSGWCNYSVYIIDKKGIETNVFREPLRALYYDKESFYPATEQEYLNQKQ